MQGLAAAYPLSSADAFFFDLAISGFIPRNRAADAVFPTVQITLFLLCQVAVVFGHVRLFAVLQIGFACFEMRSLPWRQRAIPYTIRDAPLLATFTAVHFINARVTRINDSWAGALLRSGGPDQHHSPHRKDR